MARIAMPSAARFDEIPETVKIGLQLLRNNPTQDAGLHQRCQDPRQFICDGQLHNGSIVFLGVETHRAFCGEPTDGFPVQLLGFNPLGDSRLPVETKAWAARVQSVRSGSSRVFTDSIQRIHLGMASRSLQTTQT